jgi:hypothetical protein
LEEFEGALRDHRKNLKISCEKLKWIADRFNLISNQEVLREASALEKEKEYVRIEKDKQEEENINQVIGVVTQMCDPLVEVKQFQTEGGAPIPADFRCPLSLELMSDPVIVASGQTYERTYIQQWLDQAAQCISSHLSISREDHVSVNEHMGFSSEASEEQGNSSTRSGPLIEIGHEVQSIKETVNRNHGRGQLQGHSRNTSLSSATSSLDDGQVPTTGGANALEGLRALSVCSHYSSDVSEELTPISSATGETESPTRLPERSRLGGLTLWRRRLEDRNAVLRIISSSVSDTRGEGPNIQLQVEGSRM